MLAAARQFFDLEVCVVWISAAAAAALFSVTSGEIILKKKRRNSPEASTELIAFTYLWTLNLQFNV